MGSCHSNPNKPRMNVPVVVIVEEWVWCASATCGSNRNIDSKTKLKKKMGSVGVASICVGHALKLLKMGGCVHAA